MRETSVGYHGIHLHNTRASAVWAFEIYEISTSLCLQRTPGILTKPEYLMARLLLGKYCYNSSILASSCPSSTSHGWRGVVAGCQVLKLQLGKAIGNGNSTKVRTDSWICPTTRTVPFGPRPKRRGIFTSQTYSHEVLANGTAL